MIFTLGLHKLPFTPDSRQIIYVAGEHDEKVTELVKRSAVKRQAALQRAICKVCP